MPGQIVYSAATLAGGLRGDFWDTYVSTYKAMSERVSAMMVLDVPSDKLTETYGYYRTSPHPKRWVRGNSIPEKGFKAVAFSVTNKDYGIKTSWHANDRMDDQTKSLPAFVAATAEKFGLLDERVAYQILTGATDLNLLESIPNAPDGVGICNATDGDGAARFGVTGGNVETGGGVATSEAIRDDFFSALGRFRQFQDTEGQPLLDPGTIDGGMTVTYNVGLDKVFREAFAQRITLQTAGVSNVILDAGLAVTLRPTSRITDNDWWVILNGVKTKPMFRQTRQPVQEHAVTMDNSDHARTTKEESWQADCRYGYGIALPYGIVKVNN